MNLKGNKSNIQKAYQQIQDIIKNQQLRKYYINSQLYQLIINALIQYKKYNDRTVLFISLDKVEYRINREQIFKEINHPFLFIHYKEKELTLIGSDEELAHFDSKFNELMAEQE